MLWQCLMTEEEIAEQEARWAQELRETRTKFVKHVRQAMCIGSPTRRRQLYEQWRKDYGDDTARAYAKYTEGCLKGDLSIEPIERMLK